MLTDQGHTQAILDDLLSKIIWERVDVVFSGIFRGFAKWLKEQTDKPPDYEWPSQEWHETFHERYLQFAQQVDQTLREIKISRRHWPPAWKLPDWDRAKDELLTQYVLTALRQYPPVEAPGFLGRVTGIWMKSCAAELIRQHLSDMHERIVVGDDAELNLVMVRWLEKNLGYN